MPRALPVVTHRFPSSLFDLQGQRLIIVLLHFPTKRQSIQIQSGVGIIYATRICEPATPNTLVLSTSGTSGSS